MNKYRNIKVTVDGIKFDSKREAKRYGELKLLEKANVISGLILQPKFELQPSFRKNGKLIRGINYVADFTYFDIEKGIQVVEDVKGMETKEFKLKKKIFELKYPKLTLTIIK